MSTDSSTNWNSWNKFYELSLDDDCAQLNLVIKPRETKMDGTTINHLNNICSSCVFATLPQILEMLEADLLEADLLTTPVMQRV